ncbi:MAG: MATE family efflux transporter [Pseudomonadota bacterium]
MAANGQQVRPFTIENRHVLAIAWPTTLAYLSTPLLGLIDTGVVGQLGDAALLGGLAVGAILFDVIFTSFNFIRASTTGLVAQALGEGDDERQRLVLVRALLLSLAMGCLVLLLAPLLLAGGLWAMGVSEAVEKATIAYFTIRVLAAPLTLINYAVLGWLLGQARAGLGLALQTILNGTNIVLSIFLGLHLGWGIEGVAWATVIAEGVAVLFGLALCWLAYARSGRPDWKRVFDGSALLRLFAVNRDIMIRSFCLLFAFAFFTAQGAKFGETQLAANAILMNFFLISGYFLDGFATAAEQLAGKAVGARYRPAFQAAVRLTLIWGFILAGIATAAFFLFGPWLIDTLTTVEDVRTAARTYLPWAALTALAGVVAFQMDGVYIGATWSVEMRNMMLISLAVYLLVCWAIIPVMGNHGLWLALEVFLGMRGITLFYRLRPNADRTFRPVEGRG